MQSNILQQKAKFGAMKFVIEKCIEHGVKWEDTDFPHDQNSLVPNFSKSTEAQTILANNGWTNVCWKRADQIRKLKDKSGNLRIFPDIINPNDVQQGSLGDCYFLSALSALAEKPQRIKKLFVNENLEPNKASLYGLKFCNSGEWVCIIVDDWLPTIYNQPIFADSEGPYLWVSIIEKAYAKLHGSYSAIESG